MKKMKFIAGIASLMLAATALVPVNASAATITFTQGDVNGDGKVNVNDLYAISQYLGGEKTADSNWTTRMDADYDKIIDRTDLEMISKFCTQTLTPEKNKSTTVLTASLNETRSYMKYDVASSRISRYTLNSLDTLTNQVTATYDMKSSSVGLPDNNIAVVRLNGGSGFIIGDHLIATAAHCVFNSKGFVTDNISLYDNNNVEHHLTFSSIHIPKDYYLMDSVALVNQDYALVTVEEDLSQYGSMYMGIATDEFIDTGNTISISGFPGDYNNGRRFESGIVFEYTYPKMIGMRNTAIGGNSGGPMYYTEEDGSKVVIGILTRGGEKSDICVGPHISSTLLQFYYNNDNI